MVGEDYMSCAAEVECKCKGGRVKRRVKRGVRDYIKKNMAP